MSIVKPKRAGLKRKTARTAVCRDVRLDQVFGALSDTTRRHMLKRLARGPATVGELAQPFNISAPAISRHLKVLESAGFVTRTVDGRVHSCELNRSPLTEADTWMNVCRKFWESTFDSLQSRVQQHNK